MIEKKDVLSLEKLADLVVTKVTADYATGVGMQEIRKKINELVAGYTGNMTDDDKREFAINLRRKFERLRQFAEASHTEVLSATGNFGW